MRIKLFEEFEFREEINIDLVEDILLSLIDKGTDILITKMDNSIFSFPREKGKYSRLKSDEYKNLTTGDGELNKLIKFSNNGHNQSMHNYYMIRCTSKDNFDDLLKDFGIGENIASSFSPGHTIFKRLNNIGIRCHSYNVEIETNSISFRIDIRV